MVTNLNSTYRKEILNICYQIQWNLWELSRKSLLVVSVYRILMLLFQLLLKKITTRWKNKCFSGNDLWIDHLDGLILKLLAYIQSGDSHRKIYLILYIYSKMALPKLTEVGVRWRLQYLVEMMSPASSIKPRMTPPCSAPNIWISVGIATLAIVNHNIWT